LHIALPAKYRVNPAWVAPAVLPAVLIIGDPGRIDRQKTWLRIVTGAVIAFITVTKLLAAARLNASTEKSAFIAGPLACASGLQAPSRAEGEGASALFSAHPRDLLGACGTRGRPFLMGSPGRSPPVRSQRPRIRLPKMITWSV
jgi:hypothetical protein